MQQRPRYACGRAKRLDRTSSSARRQGRQADLRRALCSLDSVPDRSSSKTHGAGNIKAECKRGSATESYELSTHNAPPKSLRMTQGLEGEERKTSELIVSTSELVLDFRGRQRLTMGLECDLRGTWRERGKERKGREREGGGLLRSRFGRASKRRPFPSSCSPDP